MTPDIDTVPQLCFKTLLGRFAPDSFSPARFVLAGFCVAAPAAPRPGINSLTDPVSPRMPGAGTYRKMIMSKKPAKPSKPKPGKGKGC